MAGIDVGTQESNYSALGSNKTLVFSTSTGIPYVVIYNNTSDFIDVFKGNAASPSSFAVQDAANNPTSVTGLVHCTACIDSADNIHIFASVNDQAMGGARQVRHYVFRTIDHATAADRDEWNAASEEVAYTLQFDDSSGGNGQLSACVDASDNLHIVVTDRDTNMGTTYDTLMYGHHNGTAWQTAVEIDGVTNEDDVDSCVITLAKNSSATIVPHIAARQDDGTFINLAAYLGNALNATSFTTHQIQTAIVPDNGCIDIACDSGRDNTYISYEGAGDLRVADHTNSSSWTTGWTATNVDTTDTWESTALYVHTNDDIYLFANEAVAGVDSEIRLFVDTGSGFSEDAGSPLHAAGSIDWEQPHTHWTTYENNVTTKIGYVFIDNPSLNYDEFSLGAAAVTGTAAWSEDADTMAAAGWAEITGSAAWTEDADTMTSTGLEEFIATSAWTEDADTMAASGSLVFDATSAWTEDADTIASSGAVEFIATGAWNEDPDTMVATGMAITDITATGAWTEDADTMTAVGELVFSSVGAWTEDDDTLVSSGSVANPVTGTATWTEDDDTMAAFGLEEFNGVAAWTEDADTMVASGLETFPGAAAWNEDPDTMASAGVVANPVTGTGAWTEDADTMAASGAEEFIATAAWTEAFDTMVATGNAGAPPVTGTGAWSEDDDTMVASGVHTITVTGEGAWTEDDDLMAAAGTIVAAGGGALLPLGRRRRR